ncbi:hypothetical protein [Parasediminibacterium sp. JCM 36343]|uniref:hypothetical protein n=1 Tax=Parasediminibacterium sp. JCM 36343 TaxID=3374279 RepID=UPI00397B4497
MKFVLFLIVCSLAISAHGQYYFTDIVAQQQSAQQYKLLVSKKIKEVKAVGYDPNEEITPGFSIEQTIKGDGKKIVTKTAIQGSSTTVLVNEYANGKLMNSISSNVKDQTTVETTTVYTYNRNGSIASIATNSSDTAVTATNNSEIHIWQYNEHNIPSQMLRIKSGHDTMRIVFTYDEKGYLAEEKWQKNGQITENYYYYYNDAGLLTDVVRYNSMARKLLPDFIYEYDADGKVVKMIQSIKGGTDHLTWRYDYNENGLRQTENCYSKQNQFVGKVVYQYQ